MGESVEEVVGPGGNRHIQMVSGKYLGWHVDNLVVLIEFLHNFLFQNFHVDLGHPRVCVDDCEFYTVRVDHLFLEDGLKMFSAPGNVGSFPLLLVFPHLVQGIFHQPELVSEH